MAMTFIHAAVLAVLIILSSSSCSHRGGSGVQDALSATDSLMMTDPRAALDTLLTIDSSSVERLGRSDMAFYTLLKTEAEYKCWLPVAEDTAVFKAAAYYGRRGPDDRLVRALIMQGAVQYERGDAEAAMESYKSAEPVAERVGDMEQLGLLHTRIGELYHATTVNFMESIERTKAAVACFKEAGEERRAVNETFSLASMYLAVDSLDRGYDCIVSGLEYAESLGDTSLVVNGRFLLSGYFYYLEPPDYEMSRRVALSAVGLLGDSDWDILHYRDDLFHFIAGSYAAAGQTDSAHYYLQKINGNDLRTKVCKYEVLMKIARSEGDSTAFLKNKMKADSLYYVKRIQGYEHDLAKSELRSENRLMKERYAVVKKQHVIHVMAAVIALLCIVATAIYLYSKMKMRAVEAERMAADLNLKGKEKERDYMESQERSARLLSRLEQESSAKEALISINGKLLKVNDSLLDAYYRYGSTSAFSSAVSRIIDEYFPENSTRELVREMVDLAYPGYLSSLSSEYGPLTDRQMYLVALMCCGFSTSTMCVLYRCSENTLNVTKSRVARKMGITGSLSAFIADGLKPYFGD